MKEHIDYMAATLHSLYYIIINADLQVTRSW